MDYKNLPPEGKADFAQIMDDMLNRAGEDAVVGFARIGALLAQIKEQYGKEQPPEEANGQNDEDGQAAFLEAAQMFIEALGEDEEIKRLQEQGLSIDQQIQTGAFKKAAVRTIERMKAISISHQLPAATSKRPKEIAFPIDKVNANIWKLLERDMGGQIAFAAENVKDKSKNKQVNILYSIDFGDIDKDVRITRQLEPFDKRVYIAMGALWAAGNQIMTINQIFYAMGQDGYPAPNQIAKIEASLKKMLAARVDIDNTQEANAYKYPQFRYHGNLLPMEFITASMNGQTVDGAIHIFREPPLISFARERKQITTIKRQLLTTPLNKTNENLMLEDYLLECIAHTKNGRRNKKILYSTIYAEARITDRKHKQRAPEKIKRILDYYKKCGHIKGYREEQDAIVLDV